MATRPWSPPALEGAEQGQLPTYSIEPGFNDGTADAHGAGDFWVVRWHGGEIEDGHGFSTSPAGFTSGHRQVPDRRAGRPRRRCLVRRTISSTTRPTRVQVAISSDLPSNLSIGNCLANRLSPTQ